MHLAQLTLCWDLPLYSVLLDPLLNLGSNLAHGRVGVKQYGNVRTVAIYIPIVDLYNIWTDLEWTCPNSSCRQTKGPKPVTLELLNHTDSSTNSPPPPPHPHT